MLPNFIDLKGILPTNEEKKSIESSGPCELLIIGGGPAGLTAALYSARKKVETLLLAKDIGGQMLITADIENYMGYRYITGRELIEKFKEQIEQFPIDILVGEEVEELVADDGQFTATTTEGKEFTSKAVIIASGKRSHPLNVPGEKKLVGRGVTYCSTCDAPLFAGMDVAVIGGGNSAIEAVTDLIKVANKIYVVNVAQSWQGDEILVEQIEAASNVTPFLGYQVVEIHGEGRVEGITIKSAVHGVTTERSEQGTDENINMPVQGVFVEIGLLPNSDFAKDLVELNQIGEIIVDCDCRTSMLGIFSAGDVTTVPEKQIIVAAGEGAKAALNAYRYLLKL